MTRVAHELRDRARWRPHSCRFAPRASVLTAVFDAVAGEMERLLEADDVWLNR